MNDYSIKDHVAYSMGFRDGKESQAATIAGLQAAVIQCRSLTELLKPQADRIAELEGALLRIINYVEDSGRDYCEWYHDTKEMARAALKGSDCG